VNFTGNTSMEIGIKVIAENIQSQIKRHVNSCFFTMVAIGQNGKPSSVPTFTPSTPDELRRHRGAQLRREIRRKYEDDAISIRSL
jgi:acyl-CoA hydrolase